MHLILKSSCALAVFLTLTACAAAPAAPSESATIPSVSAAPSSAPESVITQLDALYEQLDTTRLPLREYGGIQPYEDSMEADLPAQLLIDTPEAYRLAWRMMDFIYPTGNVLEDFTAPLTGYRAWVTQTAVCHTAPIALVWTGGTDGSFETEQTDHVLAYLIKNEIAEGRFPSDLFYEDDVLATAKNLFGDDVEFHGMDIKPYYYYRREKIFSRVGDFGGPYHPYPQLLRADKTDKGYICEAIIVAGMDRENPSLAQRNTSPDRGESIPLTAENFDEATADYPILRYTFEEQQDGRLALRGLETIRKDTRKA